MTRWIIFFIALGTVFSCERRGDRLSASVYFDLDKIRKRGYFTAFVDNNSSSYFIYRGTPMGFEYELLQRLADDLNLELQIKVISGIPEAIDLLNDGKGDILAFPLTITLDRREQMSFTSQVFLTRQVLVQRKGQDNPLVRNVHELAGKEVYVKQGSSFKERLENLSKEIGGEIIIIEDSAGAETEALIRKVARGDIAYTVADQYMAKVNAIYYPNLDVQTPVSLPQQIAWAVRKSSPHLLDSVNQWLDAFRKTATFAVIYEKYFNSPRNIHLVGTSDYSSVAGNKLSPFDDQIKSGAKILGWDWRLLASVIYQESNFRADVRSWAGAVGLMQVMPETGRYFGVSNLYDPAQNMTAGIKLIKFLDDQWKKTVTDEDERLQFILASYNAGMSHVIDSKNLARKYGKDPTRWVNVEYYLVRKTDPKYFRDAVSPAGYCNCEGVSDYIKDILQRYEEYKIHFK